MAVMAWISTSWQYSLSIPLVVGGGEALRGLAAAALVWLSRLVEGASPLAQAWVEAKSTIKILSTSSVGSTRAAWPWKPLACWRAYFAIALPHAQH
jgi:hypothetical protein